MIQLVTSRHLNGYPATTEYFDDEAGIGIFHAEETSQNGVLLAGYSAYQFENAKGKFTRYSGLKYSFIDGKINIERHTFVLKEK